jgi:hypothetical protein
LVVGLTVFCLAAFPGGSGPVAVPTAEAAPPKPKPGAKPKPKPKVNPRHKVNVKAAMAQLHAAKRNLISAPVKYGGHRDRALRSIDSAMGQLRHLYTYLHKAEQ